MLLACRLTAIVFWQKLANCNLFKLKTFSMSVLNQLLSSKRCPGCFLPIIFQQNLPQTPQISCEFSHFYHKFVSENPAKFDFFSATCNINITQVGVWGYG